MKTKAVLIAISVISATTLIATVAFGYANWKHRQDARNWDFNDDEEWFGDDEE